MSAKVRSESLYLEISAHERLHVALPDDSGRLLSEFHLPCQNADVRLQSCNSGLPMWLKA